MKIFNWVHRRFNNKAENAKKNDDIDAVDDEQFPVENKCNHVFERWRGGILTIGTLGYDPLKDDENEQAVDDYSFYEEEDDDDIDIDIEGEDSDSDEEEVETEDEEQNPLVVEVGMEEKWNDHEDELQFGYEYVMMKKQERTTLADLFSADSDQDHHHLIMKKQPKPVNNNNNNKVNPSELLKDKSNRKHSLSKLITAKDARPIHKFNQLMRRMLKRKIHPDVGPINSKPAPVINKCRPTDDYASLLPTQDGNI